MDFIHHASIPATKSELELFHIPPTQTAIESYYEVEYRPTSTLDNAKTYDINIPASDDFTDLSETMIYVKVNLRTEDNKDIDVNKVGVCKNFGAALFEQVDFYLNSVNIGQSNNLYTYQSFIEDLLFSHTSELAAGHLWVEDLARSERITKPFDLYFRLHIPMCAQDNLLLNNVPILLRLTRSANEFGLCKTDTTIKYKINIQELSVVIRRVKIFPDVSLAIQSGLEKASAKYFIVRNEMKSFNIPLANTSVNFESVFNGILPRRMILCFVADDVINGKSKEGPFFFPNNNIKSISTSVNGSSVPSISYNPDFENNLYMREFTSLYKYLNQHEGIPMCSISHGEYKKKYTLFAFDLSPDVSLGGETGTLSLIKRGNIKVEVKFAKATTTPVHMIVFAQFDNLIEIDKYRNVSIDW